MVEHLCESAMKRVAACMNYIVISAHYDLNKMLVPTTGHRKKSEDRV